MKHTLVHTGWCRHDRNVRAPTGDPEGAGAAYRALAAARAAALGAGHAPRARSHCRVAPPSTHFRPDPPIYPVPL